MFGGLAVLGVVGAASMTASAAGSTVDALSTASFGTVLTDAQGFALYTLPTDQDGMSSCTGACVAVWPALTVASGTTPTAGPGVNGTVAAVVQSNGTSQVTYNGSPLYTFVGDTAAGQVTGNNVGGFKVAQVAAAPPTTTAPPTTAPAAATASPSPSTPAPGASSAPTTQAPAAASSNPPAQPATAAATGAPAQASSSSPAVSSAATTLAVTGPGPALLWMTVVGAGLLVVSVLLLVVVGDTERRGRRVLARTRRAGEWMLGRVNSGRP